MTILGQIRKRPGILIGILALALFAFILGDIQGVITKWTSVDTAVVGEVNGDGMSTEEYDNLRILNEQQSQNANFPLQADNAAWSQLIEKTLYTERFNNLGFVFNDALLYQSFGMSEEEFNAQLAKMDPKQRSMFEMSKEAQKGQLMKKMYFDLLSSGIMANKYDVQSQKSRGTAAATQFVKIDYAKYAQDNKIEITDEEIKQYIKDNPSKFKAEQPTVDMVYAFFPNQPSKNDLGVHFANMNAYKNGGVVKDVNTGEVLDSVASFQSTSNDSVYLADIGLAQYFSRKFYKENQLPDSIRSLAKSAANNTIFGPYKEGNVMSLYKLRSKRLADSIESKHILIKTKESGAPDAKYTLDQARVLGDSLLDVLEIDSEKFGELVTKFSEDGSKSKGGVVGFSSENNPTMVQPYQKFLEENEVGVISMVESQFGVHIVEITKKIPVGPMLYNVIALQQAANPSDKTSDENYRKAQEFFQNTQEKDLQAFIDAASKEKVDFEELSSIERFPSAPIGKLRSDFYDPLLKWMFEKGRKENQSNYFRSILDESYVVARFNSKNDTGLQSLSTAKPKALEELRKEKVSKLLLDKIKAGQSLEQLATQYKTTVQNTVISKGNSMIQGVGQEPAVVGAAFGVKPNTVSKPIVGKTGLYVIKVSSVSQPPESQLDENQLRRQFNGQAMQLINNSMRDKAEIKDNRAAIYVN